MCIAYRSIAPLTGHKTRKGRGSPTTFMHAASRSTFQYRDRPLAILLSNSWWIGLRHTHTWLGTPGTGVMCSMTAAIVTHSYCQGEVDGRVRIVLKELHVVGRERVNGGLRGGP